LGFLVLIAIGWGILIVRVPMLLQGAFPSFLLDRDSGVARLGLSNQSAIKPWSQEIFFDTRSGACDWKMSREIDGTFFRFNTDLGTSKYRIICLDPNEGIYRLVSMDDSKVADRDFQFPHFPYQVNGRYGVAESFTNLRGNLTLLDFADESSKPKMFKVAGSSMVGGIKPIDGVDAFLRYRFVAPAAGTQPTHLVQYFSVDDDLVVKPGATWQVLFMGTIPSQSTTIFDEEIVSRCRCWKGWIR
jgi:hypothetical protein